MGDAEGRQNENVEVEGELSLVPANGSAGSRSVTGQTRSEEELRLVVPASENDLTQSVRKRTRSEEGEEELALVTSDEDGGTRSVRRRSRSQNEEELTRASPTPAPSVLQIAAMQRSIMQLIIGYSGVSATQRRLQPLLDDLIATSNHNQALQLRLNGDIEDLRTRFYNMLSVLVRFLSELRRSQQQRSEDERRRALDLSDHLTQIQEHQQQLIQDLQQVTQSEVQDLQQRAQSEVQALRQDLGTRVEEVVRKLTADVQQLQQTLRGWLLSQLNDAIGLVRNEYETRARNLEEETKRRIRAVNEEAQRRREAKVEELDNLVKSTLQKVLAIEVRLGNMEQTDRSGELDKLKTKMGELDEKLQELQSQTNANQRKNAEIQAESERREIERNVKVDVGLRKHNDALIKLSEKVEELNASNEEGEVKKQLEKLTQEFVQIRNSLSKVPAAADVVRLERELENLRTEVRTQPSPSSKQDEAPDGGSPPEGAGDSSPGSSGEGPSNRDSGANPCHVINNITIKQYNRDSNTRSQSKKEEVKTGASGAHANAVLLSP